MQRILRLAALVSAVAVLSVVAAGCSGGQEETPQAGEPQSTTSAETDVATGASGVGTAVGQTPPPFTLPDLDGNPVSLSDFEGDVVVIDLWATWCPPCKKEIPFLVSLYEEFKDQGLVIVGIGLDRGGAPVLKPFVADNAVSYEVLVGNETVGRDYGVSSIPMTLMVGRDGLVASKDVGFASSMEAEMRARVIELLEQRAPEA
jgi:thiol-disulfide isomerase/thioredoxin